MLSSSGTSVDKSAQEQHLQCFNGRYFLLSQTVSILCFQFVFEIFRQRRRNFPKKATRILNEYFETHMNHPYPDEPTKTRLAQACGVSVAQVSLFSNFNSSCF
jgi:hypothetical protein